MHRGNIDLMIEYSVAVLATGDAKRTCALVRDLARKWPREKALSICFAITSAASQFEDLVKGQAAPAALAYKLSALVAADILAIEALGRQPATGQDLLHFWRRVDPYFFEI